jgi:hypothetical protein
VADRAGTLVGIRVNAGPLNLKVTRFDLDFETKHNRSVTTDGGQAPRTIITQGGGIIKGTGYVDPSDTGSAFLLAAIGAPGTQQDLTACKYLIDISETGGSRHGYNIGTAKLVVTGITGQTDEGGMQEINFEVHASAAITYSSTLT